jgi:fructose-specific phosphotransferase system IIC component
LLFVIVVAILFSVSTMKHLAALTNSKSDDSCMTGRAGFPIANLGVTNFNTACLRALVTTEHIPIMSNQVSFSIVDQRPLQRGMVEFCTANNIKLVAYGSVLGGFLSSKWKGVNITSKEQLSTTSLRKYYGFIQQFGGWKVASNSCMCVCVCV